MHQYLEDTKYAIRGLISLIGDEEARLLDLQHQLEVSHNERRHAQSILLVGAPPSGFGEDTTPYFEKRARDAGKKIAELERSITLLQAAIDAKAFSVHALAGAILQVAKQGIVVTHGGLAQCPPGKRLGSETLKNVVWEGRNQAMHWDDGIYNKPAIACFANLERDFGPQFSLGGSPASSLAKVVIGLLKWIEFDIYMNDMHSLLG
jgi:hypothetical protein